MNHHPCESCFNDSNVYINKQETRFDSKTKSTACQKRTALIAIFFVVLVAIIVGCLTILLFIQTPTSLSELKGLSKRRDISLEELFKNKLVTAASFKLHTWLSDSRFLLKDERGDLIIFTIDEHQIEETTPEIFLDNKVAHTVFNADGSKVAFLKPQPSYPTTLFECEIAHLPDASGTRRALSLKNKTLNDVQAFQFNPAKGESDFVFVYKNDLYYQRSSENPESVIRVTHSDSPYITYGQGDWMIQEEITKQGLWWSTSGRFVAYASYDSRNTSKTTLTYQKEQYNVSYPRPGDQYLHGVWLFIWDKKEQTRQFALPDDNHVQDSENAIQYLFSAAWTEFEHLGEVLFSIWANRLQNVISITMCPLREQCSQFFKFKYLIGSKQLWAEPKTLSLKFFSSTGLFVVLPQESSNGDIFDNIAHIDIGQINATNLPRHKLLFHTFEFDVAELVGYDRKRDDLFFTGSGLVGEMHLFRIQKASTDRSTGPQCITCPIKDCHYSTSLFSPPNNRILIKCESPYKTPLIYLKFTSDITKNYLIRPGISSSDIPPPDQQTDSTPLPTVRFEVITLSHGLNAYVQLILPPDFDPKSKHPVIVSVYGGPNSHNVLRKTPDYLDTYFSIKFSAIVVKVDGRGSDLRGWNLKHQVYRHLGGPEIEDQMETIRTLLTRFPFMDSSRISIVGWSYGGFAALHASESDTSRIIKCAVSGGSVVDFLNYDAAYTERYMGMPRDNRIGYADSSVLVPEKLEVFRRIKLMLIHGLSDENVLFDLNTSQLIRKLQLYNYNFTQLLYPDETHALEGTKLHLVAEIQKFLSTNCFN